MKVIELLDVLTSTGKGVKIYNSEIMVDENLIFRGNLSYICDCVSDDILNSEIFQIISDDYENYVAIAIRKETK